MTAKTGRKNIVDKKFVKFLMIGFLFNLWATWMEEPILFFGNFILFDLFYTKVVKWNFWKKRNPNTKTQFLLNEWMDAFIFAIVAAVFIRIFFIEAYTIPSPSMEQTLLTGDYIFVSKLHYGPKLPNTPLSFPFTHHTLPLIDKKSYVTWLQLPYKRLTGFSTIKKGDVIVFNYPDGDTVSTVFQSEASYYQLSRLFGREEVRSNKEEYGEIIYRPVDKRENFIKRCVALPGDTIYIERGIVYVNGQREKFPPGGQFNYYIKTDGSEIPTEALENFDIQLKNEYFNPSTRTYNIPLTQDAAAEIQHLEIIKGFRKAENRDAAFSNSTIFPHHKNYLWTEDHFGPLYIPRKNDVVVLNNKNLPLYYRIITTFENNRLDVVDGNIFINGQKTRTYQFEMDYYFMIGDNRHNSADSRYWGFVPENHIVGKAIFIWLSINHQEGGNKQIRWNRVFHKIK